MTKTTVGVIIQCNDCKEFFDAYLTAVQKAQKHANETGHSLIAEETKVFTIKPKKIIK
jgi:hypothetical protein